MDFKFTPEQEALRKEFDDFFREEMKNAPPGYVGGMEGMSSEEGWLFHKEMAGKMAKKGWLVRPWPKEYGGSDAPVAEQLILSEVMGYYGAPGIDIFGVGMLGPTLLAVGNEDQKKEHLPPVARAERFWCQGWSEPNAGSDLASLTTHAKRDGDEYVINGQKIWTSNCHHADWIFLLARTNPDLRRSRGISFFLLDLNTPGITKRPIYSMQGSYLFNEVFFDDVRVPAKNLVGEEDQGWAVTRATMNFERTSVGIMSAGRRDVEELVKFCKETKWNGKTLADNPLVRSRLAQLAIECEVGRALSYRIAWMQETAGLGPEAAGAASAAKVFGSEMGQRITYTGCQLLGMYGQVKADSKWALLSGKYEDAYQLTSGANLAGGSSEIQRNLVAWVSLGLPRT